MRVDPRIQEPASHLAKNIHPRIQEPASHLAIHILLRELREERSNKQKIYAEEQAYELWYHHCDFHESPGGLAHPPDVWVW